MTPENPFSIPLSRILEDSEPATPLYNNWVDIIEFMEADPYQNLIVENLVLDYKINGRWRSPISLSYDDSGNLYVANGTHRIVAAFRMNLEEVTVKYRKDHEDDFEPLIFAARFESSKSTPNDWENIWDLIRSVRIDSENWVETDLMSLDSTSMECEYYAEDVPDMESDDLEEFLQGFLNTHFPNLDLIVSITGPGYYDELYDD